MEAPDETNLNVGSLNKNTLEKDIKDKEEQGQEIPNNETLDSELINESIRKASDGTPRKVSDIVARRLSDTATPDARSNTLTFRDVMLSMLVPSSESGSDVESNSDEDEYLIVSKETPEKSPHHSPPFANDADEDTPPQRPPRRHKSNGRKHNFDNPIDSDLNSSKQDYQITVEANDQCQDLPTAEVDGVDIDTIGNTDQVVSCIDQGEDTVILDVKGEATECIADDSVHLTLEWKHSVANVEVESDNDESLLNKDTVGNVTGIQITGAVDDATDTLKGASGTPNAETSNSSVGTPIVDTVNTNASTPGKEAVGSATGIPNAECDTHATDTPQKATDVSCDDISKKLSLQLGETTLESSRSNSSLNNQTGALIKEEEETAEDVENDVDEEEEVEEEEELSCQSSCGGAVPLTRVKCVVSMTTPRDARAHGATDCPSFVEFDMSVDGFGCLFLPAIAPQISAGKDHYFN